MKEDLTCLRCGKEFDRKAFLARHLKRKIPCEFLKLDIGDTDPDIVAVSTDDIILNHDKIVFPELETFSFMEKFEPDQTYSVIIAAIRRSGKTTMIRHVYPFLKAQYDLTLFISNSIHNECYNFVTGPRFPDHNPQMFRDLLRFQKKTRNMFRILVILDDCVSVNKKNDDALLQFFVRGRNSNISIMLASQSPKMINKNNRGNSDFVIIGNNPSAEFREDVIKSFLLGAVPIPNTIKTRGQKIDFLNAYVLHHTKDHGFIVMDNIEHEIYKFKTPM